MSEALHLLLTCDTLLSLNLSIMPGATWDFKKGGAGDQKPPPLVLVVTGQTKVVYHTTFGQTQLLNTNIPFKYI